MQREQRFSQSSPRLNRYCCTLVPTLSVYLFVVFLIARTLLCSLYTCMYYISFIECQKYVCFFYYLWFKKLATIINSLINHSLTFIIPFQLSPVATRNSVRKAIAKSLKWACSPNPSQGCASEHSEKSQRLMKIILKTCFLV